MFIYRNSFLKFLTIFLCFQGVEEELRNKWVNTFKFVRNFFFFFWKLFLKHVYEVIGSTKHLFCIHLRLLLGLFVHGGPSWLGRIHRRSGRCSFSPIKKPKKLTREVDQDTLVLALIQPWFIHKILRDTEHLQNSQLMQYSAKLKNKVFWNMYGLIHRHLPQVHPLSLLHT